MAAEGKRKKGFIVSLVGLVLVILGVLWITIIFPAVDKVPTDYDRTYYFEGTFSVMNPVTQSMDTFPVEQTLAQEAVGTEDGALLIHEVRTVVNSATGTDISARYGDESTIAIDRSTLEFVQEIDERGRWGQWGPPRPIGKDDSYDLWHPGAGQPLTANYVRSEDFRDLGVLVFEIDEEDIDIGLEPQSGLPLSISTKITQWVEPSSGTVVYNESVTTTSIAAMGMKVPIQISILTYAEETTVDLMDTGRSAHTMLFWFRTVIPWLLIGLGAVMVLIDMLFLGRRREPQEIED
ncbi:MAG: porin PorA family protein [Dehalococcoidia bacterium]